MMVKPQQFFGKKLLITLLIAFIPLFSLGEKVLVFYNIHSLQQELHTISGKIILA